MLKTYDIFRGERTSIAVSESSDRFYRSTRIPGTPIQSPWKRFSSYSQHQIQNKGRCCFVYCHRFVVHGASVWSRKRSARQAPNPYLTGNPALVRRGIECKRLTGWWKNRPRLMRRASEQK